jgi:hypothetical protein
MRAISIRQPWCWAILHAGKDIENRNWRTNYRGPALIHASQRFDWIEIQSVRAIFDDMGRDKDDVPYPSQFKKDDPKSPYPTGGIVGIVEVVDCVRKHTSPWFFGEFGFVLRNARPLPFMPCKGALSFFKPDIDYHKLQEALSE